MRTIAGACCAPGHACFRMNLSDIRFGAVCPGVIVLATCVDKIV